MGNSTLKQIAELEDEIFRAAELENEIRLHLRMTIDHGIRKLLQDQLAMITKRVKVARREMSQLEMRNEPEILRELRHATRNYIRTRPLIQIFEFREVSEHISA